MLNRIKEFVSWPTEDEFIVQQYQSLVREYNQLFSLLYQRTQYKEWEMIEAGPVGVGSCAISTSMSNIGIKHEKILELREERNRNTPGNPAPYACGYHREGKGCSLGDLKSPICLNYVPALLVREMGQRFGKSFTERFHAAIEEANQVLVFLQDPFDRGNRRALVQKAKKQLREIQRELEKFPVLTSVSPQPSFR